MIVGTKVRLRALTRSDLPNLVRWRNDPAVSDYLVRRSLPASIEQESDWFERSLSSQDAIRLAIETLAGGEHIGYIVLSGIDWRSRRAELGILIGETRYQNQNYGSDATVALLTYAFKELGLHRVYVEILESNSRSIKMFERIGFQLEGRLREHVYRNGAYHGVLVMAIIDRELAAGRDSA